MADVYQPLDETMVAKLAFKKQLCNYIYIKGTHSKKTLGQIYNLEKEVYDKIEKIFKGDEAIQLKKGDKVFMLPGHSLTQSRVKTYLKKQECTLVTDITKATVIAGSNKFSEKISNRYDLPKQAKLASIMFKGTPYMLNENDASSVPKTLERIFDEALVRDEIAREWQIDKKPCVLSLECKFGYDANLDAKVGHFMTPEGMYMLFNILSRKLKVLTDDAITSKAHSNVKLNDDEVFDQIYAMLSSNNKPDNDLGVELLVHADLEGITTYKIWKLSKVFGNKVSYSPNTKDLRNFMAKTDWLKMISMNTAAIVSLLEKQNQLTPKVLQEVLPPLVEDLFKNIDGRMENDKFFEVIPDDDSIIIQLKNNWVEKRDKDVKLEPA